MGRRALSYILLVQPGYIISNSFSIIAGFMFGSNGSLDIPLLSALLVSTALLAGAGITLFRFFNSDVDTSADFNARRAKSVEGITRRSAFVFAACITVVGIVLVCLFVNVLAIVVATIGGIAFVGLSGPMQRRFKQGAIFNNLPAALVVLYSYVAVTNRVDWSGIQLFLFAGVFYIVAYLAMRTDLFGGRRKKGYLVNEEVATAEVAV